MFLAFLFRKLFDITWLYLLLPILPIEVLPLYALWEYLSPLIHAVYGYRITVRVRPWLIVGAYAAYLAKQVFGSFSIESILA